jgi:hypothetical protein
MADEKVGHERYEQHKHHKHIESAIRTGSTTDIEIGTGTGASASSLRASNPNTGRELRPKFVQPGCRTTARVGFASRGAYKSRPMAVPVESSPDSRAVAGQRSTYSTSPQFCFTRPATPAQFPRSWDDKSQHRSRGDTTLHASVSGHWLSGSPPGFLLPA